MTWFLLISSIFPSAGADDLLVRLVPGDVVDTVLRVEPGVSRIRDPEDELTI